MLPENGLVYFTDEYEIGNVIIGGSCSIYSYNSDEKELSENNTKDIVCYGNGLYIDITSTGDIVDQGIINGDLNNLMETLCAPQREKGQVLTMTSDSKYGWSDIIPKITPPTGTSKSDLANLYNELPESGLVFFTSKYVISNIIINGLCGVTYMMSSGQPIKYIICYESGMGVIISSTGNILDAGFTNPNLDTLIGELESSDRQKGQVFTMLSDNRYGWGDAIPHITPPEHSTTSDIVNFYNMLPESGLVFIIGGYSISVPQVDSEINKIVDLVGLCSTVSFTSDDAKQCKTIVCYSTATFVQITSTGQVLYSGMCNEDLDHLMPVLTNPNRKKGQVLTMTSNSEYGWADTTPQFCIHKITDSDQVPLTLDSYQLIEVSETPTDLSTPTTTKILQLPYIEDSDKHAYKIHVLLMGSNSIVYRLSMSYGVCGNLPNTFVSGKIYECIFTYLGSFWLCQCIEYERSNAPV